jgi:hypothetical protein
MIKRCLTCLGIFCSSVLPVASFENTDLEAVGRRAQTILGAEYRGMMGRGNKSITLGCSSCAGLTMVVFAIGRQTDGTEERVRSGQTTVADLQRQCQANEPSCRIERADMGRAVGWLSTYGSGVLSGNTLVLLRDGNMLTVRSTADTPQTSRENLRRMQTSVIPQIVGR